MILFLSVTAGVPSHAQPGNSTDFSPEGPQWNGLSTFLEIARENQIALRYPAHVHLREIGPQDGVLLINPGPDLPAREFAERIEGGLRVALADDFGRGTATGAACNA